MNFNDWTQHEIIHKNDILNFDFLQENEFIKEIEEDFYFLTVQQEKLEECFYDFKTKEIQKKLKINNIETEIQVFIAKLNKYNEIKDIADEMLGKLAELKGVSLKEIHEEFLPSD